MKPKIAILLIISLFAVDANAQFLDKLKDFAEKIDEQLENATEEIEKTLSNDTNQNSEASKQQGSDIFDSCPSYMRKNVMGGGRDACMRHIRRMEINSLINDPNSNDIQSLDYRLSVDDINSVPQDDWLLVWRKTRASNSNTENVKIYIDSTERGYPYDIGAYKFIENGAERVEVLSHSCQGDIASPGYLSNATLTAIQAFKLNSQGVYEETESVDKKYSYKQPTGQVHFYFCERIRNDRLTESRSELSGANNLSLKRAAMGGNMKPIFKSAYFQDGIKYDVNFMPYRSTKITIRPGNYCSPFFAYTGGDRNALVWRESGPNRNRSIRGYYDAINGRPVTVDQLTVGFISKEIGRMDVRLTKECLNMNFNSFVGVVVENENLYNGYGSATRSFVGDGIGAHSSLPEITYLRGQLPSKFLNNPKRLSIEEIKEIYLKNLESSDHSKFNEITTCPKKYFERRDSDYGGTLYHIYTGELVIPDHLSGDQFMTRGFAEEDVSNRCMERMIMSFRGLYNRTKNNPKYLGWDEIETLYEKNHYKVSL